MSAPVVPPRILSLRALSPEPRAMVFVSVLLGTLTVSLNNTALNPALPHFMEAFGIGAVQAGWILTGFMIAMATTLPLTGYLSCRFGRRQLYLSGLALFIAGSCMGSMAAGLPWVIAARVIQGVAGGLMIPLSLALIFDVYAPEERGRITGYWGLAVMLAPAVGPLAGGVVVEVFDWHALFVMNVPFGVLAWLVAFRCLSPGAEGVAGKLDWTGFVLVTFGVGALLICLTRITDAARFADPFTIAPILAALACLALLVRVELRKSDPLLDLRIFANGSYSNSVVIAVVQAMGMFACIVCLPLLMQNVLAYSAATTGFALFATAVCASAFAKVGGTVLDTRGPRGVVASGLAVTALATAACGLLNERSPLWLIIGLMMARGVGLGLSYIPATTAGLNAVPATLVTQGSALNNILRRIMASMAVVLVSIYFEIRRAHLASAGWTAFEASSAAISEMFFAVGVMTLLAVPVALLLPRAGEYVARQRAAAGSF